MHTIHITILCINSTCRLDIVIWLYQPHFWQQTVHAVPAVDVQHSQPKLSPRWYSTCTTSTQYNHNKLVNPLAETTCGPVSSMKTTLVDQSVISITCFKEYFYQIITFFTTFCSRDRTHAKQTDTQTDVIQCINKAAMSKSHNNNVMTTTTTTNNNNNVSLTLPLWHPTHNSYFQTYLFSALCFILVNCVWHSSRQSTHQTAILGLSRNPTWRFLGWSKFAISHTASGLQGRTVPPQWGQAVCTPDRLLWFAPWWWSGPSCRLHCSLVSQCAFHTSVTAGHTLESLRVTGWCSRPPPDP